MPVIPTTVVFQSKFFLASETVQCHVREIVEKDAREMEPLLQMEKDALKGLADITKYDTNWHQFYRHMGGEVIVNKVNVTAIRLNHVLDVQCSHCLWWW